MDNVQRTTYLKIAKLFVFIAVGIVLISGIVIYLYLNYIHPESGGDINQSVLALWFMIAVVISGGLLILFYIIHKQLLDYKEEILKNCDSFSNDLNYARDSANVMDELIYKDSLTGIRNKMAYEREAQRLAWGITSKSAEFAIATVDLLGLKDINDKYGHEQGNLAIKNLSNLICDIFAHAAVFRMKNGEFIVVLEKRTYNEADRFIYAFEHKIEENANNLKGKPWEEVRAVLGFARYEPALDTSVWDVLNRAEKNMKNKKEKLS